VASWLADKYGLALGGKIFLTGPERRRRNSYRENLIMWPPKFSDAIDALNVARRRCEHLVTAGLAQPDVNKVASVIVTARDCARIATLTTQLLERGSKYAYPICGVCAQACEELARACEKHSKVEAFSRCAEACRKCAQECSKLAKAKKPAR
jgi:hypothetical protein